MGYSSLLLVGLALCLVIFQVESLGFEEMGCVLGGQCKYTPTNAIQLQACGTAGKLEGMHTKNLFLCQEKPNEEECRKVKTDDGKDCQWIEMKAPSPYAPGACLPWKLSGDKPYIISKMGMRQFWAALKDLGLKAEDFPTTKQQNDCQQFSYDEAACLKAKDEKGRQCGWCTGFNPEHYPFTPPTSSLCLQQQYIDWKTCDALKGELVLCPTKAPTMPPTSSSTFPPSSSTFAPTVATSSPTGSTGAASVTSAPLMYLGFTLLSVFSIIV